VTRPSSSVVASGGLPPFAWSWQGHRDDVVAYFLDIIFISFSVQHFMGTLGV